MYEIAITIAFVVLILWITWRKQHLAQFEMLNIPGPKPSIVFGNIIELYRKGPLKCHEEWVRKYGRVVGYFYGMTPVLLIADPQLLKNILIKDFPKFMNRPVFNPISKYDPHNEQAQSVLNLPGKPWKELRSVLTPTFTVAKMKQMSGSMISSIEAMNDIIKERADSESVFDITDTYQRVTMDVITRTAFGVRTDIQTNFKSKLLNATKLLFSTIYRDPIIFIGLCFPYLRFFCLKLQFLVLGIMNKGVKPNVMLRKGLLQVLEHRKQNPQMKKSDLLQLMIDTKIYSDSIEVDIKQLEMGNADTEEKWNRENKDEYKMKAYRTLKNPEILSTSLTVLLAGYETTSTALSFTTYLLAKNQDVQEKLYEEIRELVRSGQNFEYATINKLQYLDKVFNESLRIYPPVYLFTNRYALEEVHYDRLKIPKGTQIQAPVHLLHHDPEFWTDPEKFVPERFNEKPNLNGITYLPFGVGPRNCLGMRFAQLEAKLVLAHLIYKFKIYPANINEEDLKLLLRVRTLAPLNGIAVKVQMREEN